MHEEAKPKVEPLTIDDARISVAKAVIGSLQRTITAESERIQAPDLDQVEVANGQLMVQAARELVVTLEAAAANFERPRILRPERQRRIFKG